MALEYYSHGDGSKCSQNPPVLEIKDLWKVQKSEL